MSILCTRPLAAVSVQLNHLSITYHLSHWQCFWNGTFSSRSLPTDININASRRSWLKDERRRVLVIFSLLKALSQLTWVNHSVNKYSYTKKISEKAEGGNFEYTKDSNSTRKLSCTQGKWAAMLWPLNYRCLSLPRISESITRGRQRSQPKNRNYWQSRLVRWTQPFCPTNISCKLPIHPPMNDSLWMKL